VGRPRNFFSIEEVLQFSRFLRIIKGGIDL
jgi:hypothetical protein